MTTPKVSIIVAIYNLENYLATALDSITQQTLADIEIITVNDGSTDKSEEIILDYQKKDNRIVYVKQPQNKGMGQALNKGLCHAKGEYVSFPDGDDWCHKQMYETMYHKAKHHDADIVQCELLYAWTHGKTPTDSMPNPKETLLESSKEAVKHCFINRKEGRLLYPSCANKIFKRELFKNIKFTDAIVGLDTEVMSRMVLEGKRFLLLDQPFYYYFQRPQSLSNQKMSLKIVSSYAEVIRSIINFYTAHGIDCQHIMKQLSLNFVERLFKLPDQERKQFQTTLIEQTSLKRSELQRLIREKLVKQKVKQFIRFLLKSLFLEDYILTKTKGLKG